MNKFNLYEIDLQLAWRKHISESDTDDDLSELVLFPNPWPYYERMNESNTDNDLPELVMLTPEDIFREKMNSILYKKRERVIKIKAQENLIKKRLSQNRPILIAQCVSEGEYKKKEHVCTICLDTKKIKKTVELGCRHKLCTKCVREYFTHCVRQVHKSYYSCPTCRQNVKQVKVNYSKRDNTKEEMRLSNLVTNLKIWCDFK